MRALSLVHVGFGCCCASSPTLATDGAPVAGLNQLIVKFYENSDRDVVASAKDVMVWFYLKGQWLNPEGAGFSNNYNHGQMSADNQGGAFPLPLGVERVAFEIASNVSKHVDVWGGISHWPTATKHGA